MPYPVLCIHGGLRLLKGLTGVSLELPLFTRAWHPLYRCFALSIPENQCSSLPTMKSNENSIKPGSRKSCEASRHGNALLIMFSDILYMFPPPHTSGNYLSGACCFSSPEILHVSFSFLPPSIHCTILEPQVLYFPSNRVQTFSNNIWVILRCWGNSSMVCQQNSDAL